MDKNNGHDIQSIEWQDMNPLEASEAAKVRKMQRTLKLRGWPTGHDFVDADNFGEPKCSLCGKTKIEHSTTRKVQS